MPFLFAPCAHMTQREERAFLGWLDAWHGHNSCSRRRIRSKRGSTGWLSHQSLKVEVLGLSVNSLQYLGFPVQIRARYFRRLTLIVSKVNFEFVRRLEIQAGCCRWRPVDVAAAEHSHCPSSFQLQYSSIDDANRNSFCSFLIDCVLIFSNQQLVSLHDSSLGS